MGLDDTREDLALDEGMARTLLSDEHRRSGAGYLNLLARIAFLTERSKGHMEGEYTKVDLADVVEEEDREKYAGQSLHVPNPSLDAEKLLLMVTEVAEAWEDARDGKPPTNELVDVIIRALGFCYYHNFDIGGEVIAKMVKNLDRPYKHGRVR